MQIDENFGERLGQFIAEESGLSQNRFAKKVGVTQGYISQIVSGQSGPSASLLMALAVLYPNRFFYLLTGCRTLSHNAVLFGIGSLEQASQPLLEGFLEQDGMMIREQDLDVRRLGAPGDQPPVPDQADDRLPAELAETVALLGMAIRVLKANNHFSEALASNIRSFYRAVKMAEKFDGDGHVEREGPQ